MNELVELLRLVVAMDDTVKGIEFAERGAKMLTADPCKCGKEGCGMARLQVKAKEFLDVLAEVRAEMNAKLQAERAVKEMGKAAVQA
jgi:hypothetical protein